MGFICPSATRIYSLVGPQAILLPVKKGTKRCFLPGWDKMTFEKTQTPAYQQVLAVSNIAVRLGAASNIWAIDADTDRGIDMLTGAMPFLNETLATRGKKGCQFWVRITGPCPSTGRLVFDNGEAFGEWRSERAYSVIYGLHPDTGMPYELLNSAPPITVEWKDIVWPKGVSFKEATRRDREGAKEDSPVLERRRMQAEKALSLDGEVDWVGFDMGYIPCPGREAHTNQDNDSDCAVFVENGGAGLYCFHQSCRQLVQSTVTSVHTIQLIVPP